jgi:hypothetical protein
MVKIPGAAAERLTVMDGLVPAAVVTVSVAVGDESSSHGTWKLIWRGETKKSGTEIPFIVTVVPPSVVGRGNDDADAAAAARFVPNMDPMPPPEILAEKPAPSTTPLAGTDGTDVGGLDADTSRIRRVPASAMKRFPEPSTATPRGSSSDAEVAGPPSPAKASVPLPATVVMIPPADTFRIR